MPRRLVALVLVLVCLAGMAAACRGEEPLTVLGYLGQRAEQIAAQLPPLPDKAADWEKRRAEMLEQLSTVLGLPQREPMKAAVLGQKEEGDLVVEQVIYLWAERAYVAGNVIRKKDLSGRAPAIVVPPGWLGHYTWPCYKEFVFHMARQGYLVLFIDDPHIGKRAAPYAGLYAVASAAGTPVMGIQVFDTLRGLDYLMTRPDVDPGRIGVAGLCQGAEQTWLAAALDPQFQYAVPVCGTTTYAAWAAMPAVDGVALSDPSPYVAGILRVTEWDEIGAAIAPRPVFIASNSGDNWWPPAGYDKVVAAMTKAYAMQTAADRFRQLRELRSHDMTPFLPELAPWIDAQTKALAASSAAPLPCGEPEEPDCSMLRAMQRRIAAQTAPFAASLDSPAAWEAHRAQIAKWLAQACDFQGMKPAESLVKGTAERRTAW